MAKASEPTNTENRPTEKEVKRIARTAGRIYSLACRNFTDERDQALVMALALRAFLADVEKDPAFYNHTLVCIIRVLTSEAENDVAPELNIADLATDPSAKPF